MQARKGWATGGGHALVSRHALVCQVVHSAARRLCTPLSPCVVTLSPSSTGRGVRDPKHRALHPPVCSEVRSGLGKHAASRSQLRALLGALA